MKLVEGYYLPDSDTHFEAHLTGGPRFNGRGSYQLAKLKECMKHIPKHRRHRAIDVGAHVGLWSWPLAHYFPFIQAFEPNPDYWVCWYDNMDKAPCQYQLNHYGLGDVEKKVKMAKTAKNSGMSHIDENGEVEILIRPFDERTTLSFEFVKLDCEGYELFALKGMKKHLMVFRPFVLVEQKPGNGKRYGISDDAAVRYLVDELGGKVEFEMYGDYGIKL